MPWLRETILTRIKTVLDTTPGIEYVCRNRGKIPSDKRPAVQILDEDEVADTGAFGRNRPANSPNFVAMSPGIYVILKEVAPVNENVGPELNAVCAAVIKAIATDAQLSQLCAVGNGGDIRYEGLVTDLGEDRHLVGKARIGIVFVYPLDINAL